MRNSVRRASREAAWYARDPIRRLQVNAKLMRPIRVRQFGRFGPLSIVANPDWIAGGDRMWLGSGVIVMPHAWLSVEVEGRSRPAPVLQIGDRVGLRPYVTISAAESIVIEQDAFVGSFSTIIDSDHTFERGIANIMKNPVVTSPIRIGAGTWVGERCSILRGSDIGRCCIIGPNSVVRGVIPDYSIVFGVPARVVGSTRESFEAAGTLDDQATVTG